MNVVTTDAKAMNDHCRVLETGEFMCRLAIGVEDRRKRVIKVSG